MPLLAWSYDKPSFGVVLMGTLALLVVLLVLAYMRRIMIGAFGGAVGGATIAWIVLGKGEGDLVWLAQLIGSPGCGLIGAGLGALAAFVGKWIKKPPAR